MYVETENGHKWVSERDVVSLQDPARRAAEKLALRTEEFLYDQASGNWMKPEFLAWSLAMYDVEKTGSGNYANEQDFDQNELATEFADKHPAPGGTYGPNTAPNIAVRYPEHARHADWVDTDPESGDDD